jgi:hypothetical protein
MPVPPSPVPDLKLDITQPQRLSSRDLPIPLQTSDLDQISSRCRPECLVAEGELKHKPCVRVIVKRVWSGGSSSNHTFTHCSSRRIDAVAQRWQSELTLAKDTVPRHHHFVHLINLSHHWLAHGKHLAVECKAQLVPLSALSEPEA